MNLLSFNLYQLIDRHKYNYLIYNKQVGGGQFKNHPRLVYHTLYSRPLKTSLSTSIQQFNF